LIRINCANHRQSTGQPEVREYPSDPGIRASTRREILKLGRVGVSARLPSSERSMDRLLAKVPASAPHLSFEVRTSRVNSPPPEALQIRATGWKQTSSRTAFYNIPREGRSNATQQFRVSGFKFQNQPAQKERNCLCV